MGHSKVTPSPEYEIPILQAIAEADRLQATSGGKPDGFRHSYSSNDFCPRVFNLMQDILGDADFSKVPGRNENTSYAWLRLRTQCGQMVTDRKGKGKLLKRVFYSVGRKTRYQITDNGIRLLNYVLESDFKLSPDSK